jgi:hypothetical protein
MFDGTAFKGFVQNLTVNVSGLTDEAAVAAMVRTAEAARTRVLSGTPKPSGYRQVVDQIEGAPLEAVRPDGVIIFAWQYMGQVVRDIYDALVARSPLVSGAYIHGIEVVVDGEQSTPDADFSLAKQVIIVATAPYSRKLEVHLRKDGRPFVVQVAPHIVEDTRDMAVRLYGDLASIEFNYVEISHPYMLRTTSSHRKRHGRTVTNMEYPAIIIEPKQA